MPRTPTSGRQARVLLPVAGLLALLLGVPSGQPAGAAAVDALQADGESGTVTPPWTDAVNASVEPEAARTGGGGYVVDSTADAGYLTWSSEAVEQGHSHFSVRTWVQVRSQAPGESIDLLTVKNSAGGDHFDLFLTADTSRFKWDLAEADSDRTELTVTPGSWHLVEAHGEFGTTDYSATVRVDGVDQGTITSAGQAPATVLSLWLGSPALKTHTQWYDDVALRVADASIGFLGTPVASLQRPSVATRCPSRASYRLTGTVTAYGADTEYWFEWGRTKAYGNRTPAAPAGSSQTPVKVSTNAAGLPWGSTVHYRLVAKNAAGRSEGPDKKLVTATRPAGC